jgi:hypothetical protein
MQMAQTSELKLGLLFAGKVEFWSPPAFRAAGGSELRQVMKHLFFNLLVVAALAAGPAPAKQTFTGIVTDDNCPNADHSRMRMGPTDAECAKACIEAHGAVYGLYDGKSFFTLSDQKTAEKFVAKKVKVTGTLDSKTRTIQVDSITPDT